MTSAASSSANPLPRVPPLVAAQSGEPSSPPASGSLARLSSDFPVHHVHPGPPPRKVAQTIAITLLAITVIAALTALLASLLGAPLVVLAIVTVGAGGFAGISAVFYRVFKWEAKKEKIDQAADKKYEEELTKEFENMTTLIQENPKLGEESLDRAMRELIRLIQSDKREDHMQAQLFLKVALTEGPEEFQELLNEQLEKDRARYSQVLVNSKKHPVLDAMLKSTYLNNLSIDDDNRETFLDDAVEVYRTLARSSFGAPFLDRLSKNIKANGIEEEFFNKLRKDYPWDENILKFLKENDNQSVPESDKKSKGGELKRAAEGHVSRMEAEGDIREEDIDVDDGEGDIGEGDASVEPDSDQVEDSDLEEEVKAQAYLSEDLDEEVAPLEPSPAAAAAKVTQKIAEERGDWSKVLDATDPDPQNQKYYYFNTITDQSQWNPPEEWDASPAAAHVAAPSSRIIPTTPWLQLFDATHGRHYFYDRRTGVSQWEQPPGVKITDVPLNFQNSPNFPWDIAMNEAGNFAGYYNYYTGELRSSLPIGSSLPTGWEGSEPPPGLVATFIP